MRWALGFFTLAAALGVSTAIATPLSYIGGVYSQNFNGLPTNLAAPNSVSLAGRGPHDIQTQLGSTGVGGWTMSNPTGSSATTEFRAQNGSLAGASGRGVVSFGTNDSTERALGTLATSNQISSFHLTLTNNTGATLNAGALAFTVEQWRRGDVVSPGNTLAFDYAINAATLDAASGFTPLGSVTSPNTSTAVGTTEIALNGNDPANQIPVALAIPNLSWTNGSTLTLRWKGMDASGQDDGLAIDNLTFSAAVPEPTSIALFALTACLVGCGDRSRRKDRN